MLYPSIDSLLEKLDSKYTLVTIASRRARELRVKNNGYINKPLSHKFVGVALEEFVGDHIKCDNSNIKD